MTLKELLIKWLVQQYGIVTVGIASVFFVYLKLEIKGIRELIRDQGESLERILLHILAKLR